MLVNLRTAVTLVMWLALGFTVLAMAIRWTRRTQAGYGRWVSAGLLVMLSLFLLAWRPGPAWINSLSADTGAVWASILYLEGVREFRGVAPRSWLAYAGGAVAIGAVAFFLYVVPNMNARAAVTSTYLGIVLGLASVILLRRIPWAHRFGQTFTGAMLALCAATLLARALYSSLGPPMGYQNAASGVYGTFVIVIVLEMGAFQAGLALLADERVVSDLSEVRERASLAGTEIARLIEDQAALGESEERFRFAQRAAGIGTFDWNMETGVNTWTPELEAMYGLPTGGFPRTQKAFEDLLHPDDRSRTLQRIAESYEAGAPVEEEWRVIWPDGSAHWIAGRWQVFKNAAGEPNRMMGVNIDITGRKNAEEALRTSEERFRLATKATNDAIWDIDLKTGAVSWNETYTTLYGRPPETSDSWQWWIDNIHPEDREHTVNSLRAALGSRESSWTCEYRFLRVDGEWAHIYDRAYIARDALRIAYRVIGAMLDLTERKRTEAASRESEERFRRVFEEGPLGIALVSMDYRFLKVNSALCQMLGYSEEELIQKTFADITHPDDVRADAELAERLFRGEIPSYRMHKRYVKKTGEIIWINLTASLLRDREGESLQRLTMIEDVTDAKRNQEQAMLRQKLESVGTLAGGIAHDFNNLLGAVLAQAELAQMELAAGSNPERELKTIGEAAKRGSEIVRELMIYAGKESEGLGPVDVSQVVEDMLELLKISVSKHATLKTDLVQDPLIRASVAQISQLVMNLVTNASEALGEQDGVIRMTTRRVMAGHGSRKIGGLAEGEYIQLEVSDTGCGMSPETQARIFDPFFSTKSGGRGLGLAVVHGIVRGLGGVIDLFSRPGHGTTFQVLLPCAETTSATIPGSISEVNQPIPPSYPATVLVVEDEDPLRQAVSKMLRKHAFSVIEAGDGSAALNAIRDQNNAIHVLLLDITLPGASGREVLQEARRLRPNMGVIVTSAYPEKMAAASLQSEVQHFIRKPYQLDDLVQLIHSTTPSGPADWETSPLRS